MNALRARLLPILAALLMALPFGAAGSVQYFCHSMGLLMDESCCPSVSLQSGTRLREGSEIKSQDCCERLSRASSAPAPALRDSAAPIGVAAWVDPGLLVVAKLEPAEREVSVVPVEARAPPPRGPPIFLLNCSLLT